MKGVGGAHPVSSVFIQVLGAISLAARLGRFADSTDGTFWVITVHMKLQPCEARVGGSVQAITVKVEDMRDALGVSMEAARSDMSDLADPRLLNLEKNPKGSRV